ncbi:FAD-binding oxidoreductase [Kitasatospora sp. RG8]|uniref:FAD-binding oxidoreductase n=1 Tax=Kitasatospora sp. RG8 TaxID=2820815 RepID=UPI001AE05FAE|nr:FAD-binding oxidoreductase [Kitasatospora sp. RG8]MBP0450240.1 FAD-binding oxidoreductase [Kitasatospora sp. RG8]
MGGPTVDGLRERVRGAVITPADEGYDEARRVYNGMVDRRPAVIVRVANAGDVMATVDFARDNTLDLAVRGGAHSAPGFGTCDDGVVIDFSARRGVRIDPERRTAQCEGGVTWGDLNTAGYAFGLGVTGGIISTTGIAGLTLNGGFGHLARGLGLSCDNLISADVVTADGRFRTVSAEQEPDLFWALRGGGGNFGAVTSFEFRLSPVADVVAGPFVYELEHAADVLRFYREYIRDAPEQLGLFPGFHLAPPLPFVPEDRVGDPFILLVPCWAGPPAEAEKVLAALRDAAPVVAEGVGPAPYPAFAAAFDPLLPPGLQQYWKGVFATELTDGAIAAHVEYGPRVPTVNSAVHLYPINGACHRVPADATAFSHRDATFATVIAGVWPDPADNERNTAWVRDYYAALAPHSDEAGYIGFMDHDDQHRIEANYRGNYDRLVELKQRYDPGNLFHLNQNIKG